jgi:hypothetical protein
MKRPLANKGIEAYNELIVLIYRNLATERAFMKSNAQGLTIFCHKLKEFVMIKVMTPCEFPIIHCLELSLFKKLFDCINVHTR